MQQILSTHQNIIPHQKCVEHPDTEEMKATAL